MTNTTTPTTNNEYHAAERLLSTKEVSRRIAHGRTWLHHAIKRDAFPKPIKIGARTVWRECVINAWIASRALTPS